MSDELTRLLTILNNGSDQAVLDNASDIAALIRQLQRENERATRLLAAVERLGNRDTTTLTPLGMLRIDEIHILPEQGSGQWVAVSDGNMTDRHTTIADALIALAEQVVAE